MSKDLNCIMLIDDNEDDNFFHEREINKTHPGHCIIVKNSGKKALEYLNTMRTLQQPFPNLIFLDINMPGMNGWEFLQEYTLLDTDLQCQAMIIMLTTSQNPDDELKAKSYSFVTDYITKPLTHLLMKGIVTRFFS